MYKFDVSISSAASMIDHDRQPDGFQQGIFATTLPPTDQFGADRTLRGDI